jgi:hypothetical protein
MHKMTMGKGDRKSKIAQNIKFMGGAENIVEHATS